MLLFLFALLFTLPLVAQDDENGDALRHHNIRALQQGQAVESRYDLRQIAAGDAVEGDFINEIRFTRDGNEVWVVNRGTDNISVLDWETRTILRNIPVGESPVDIDFSEEYAVVACSGSNEAYIIDLMDYSVAAKVPVGQAPVKVHVSQSGALAIVGCLEDNVGELIDLNSLTKLRTINDFQVRLTKFSFITSNPRGNVYYSNFRITNDDNYVVNSLGTEPGNILTFYDLNTGMVSSVVSGVRDCGQIEMSGDGKIIVAVKTDNPGVVSQVDVATQSLIQEVFLTDVRLNSTYSPPAVNFDGSKVMNPSNPGNNALVDFDLGTWQLIENGNTPDWVGRTADANLFISGDFYLSVIDPDNGNVISTLSGISIQNGHVGNGNRIAASDPLRHEAIHYYDFSNPSNLLVREGQSTTGSELEADATYAVKFTDDGQTLLAINSLSGTLSVIDVEEETLSAIIPLGNSAETFQVDATSDGRYALVAKRLEDQVAIVDLNTAQVVANVNSGGSKPDQVFVLPGDEFAYVLNAGAGDNIGVIRLDGANSSLMSTFTTGNMGISWTNFGIRSDLKFTPDEQFALLANPFDDQVQVIDLSQHQVISSIPMEGFPLQIAVSPDRGAGQYAAVTLKNDDRLGILLGVNGQWSLLGTYPTVDNPVRVSYDPGSHAFFVISTQEQMAERFDIEELRLDGLLTFSDDILAFEFAEGARNFTLVRSTDLEERPHGLAVVDSLTGEFFALPSLPIHHLDVSEDGALVAIAQPIIDEVSLIKDDPLTGLQQVQIGLGQQLYQVFPNPATGEELQFQLREGASPLDEIDFQLYDGSGRLVYNRSLFAGTRFAIPRTGGWATGQYYFVIKAEQRVRQSGRVLLR